MKDKIILISLDAISIIIATIILLASLYIVTYTFDGSIRYMFMGIGLISTIVLYNSIMELIDEKK